MFFCTSLPVQILHQPRAYDSAANDFGSCRLQTKQTKAALTGSCWARWNPAKVDAKTAHLNSLVVVVVHAATTNATPLADASGAHVASDVFPAPETVNSDQTDIIPRGCAPIAVRSGLAMPLS